MLKDAGKELRDVTHNVTWCLEKSNIPQIEAFTMNLDIQPQVDVISQLSWQQPSGRGLNII